jgi:hypothetical protein
VHFIKKCIHDRVVEVLFLSTKDQVADIFTKFLTKANFSKLQSMLGVQEVVIKGGVVSNASFLLLLYQLSKSFNPISSCS